MSFKLMKFFLIFQFNITLVNDLTKKPIIAQKLNLCRSTSITSVFMKSIITILRKIANFKFDCSHKKGTLLKMNAFDLSSFPFFYIGTNSKRKNSKIFGLVEFTEGRNRFLFRTTFYIVSE